MRARGGLEPLGSGAGSSVSSYLHKSCSSYKDQFLTSNLGCIFSFLRSGTALPFFLLLVFVSAVSESVKERELLLTVRLHQPAAKGLDFG